MTNTTWVKAQGIAYEMPDPEAFPRAVPGWRPDATRSALLVHDMQRYFIDRFASGQQPVTSLVENVAKLVAAARRYAVPVFYTAQPGRMSETERGLLRDFWGPGMKTSTEDRSILPECGPEPGDVVLTKWRYSAFARTDLHDHLVRSGRNQLVVCGVYAHVGVQGTALDSYSRDIETFVVGDAVADFDEPRHLQSLGYVATTCARVVGTTQTVDEWRATHARPE
ncbi:MULTISPECIES: isochorismatase family protein [unclassified Micromonospora]|uniref:isochorismatase family protein n=1 Tax=unclassified Micromonospora TaxID=2617518 RepID=UPI00363016E3